MKCPFCAHTDNKVVDSRSMEDDNSIRRRRQCEKCSGRFTTYERIDIIPIMVVKRDGTRETFERDKLLNGVILACNKRPLSYNQMEQILSEVEKYILNTGNKEIESIKIGELVMSKLKILDEVAYVRFASVYKQFKDIDTFMDELSNIKEEIKEKK